MTFLDLAADSGFESKEQAKRLALKHIFRLRKAPYADMEPEEVQMLRAIYQSEVNRNRHEAGLPRPAPKDCGEGMTIKQIAKLCEVDPKTVRRWLDIVSRGNGHNVQPRPELKDRSMTAGEAGEAVHFTTPEVLAIIRAGGKGTLANLLAENSAKKAPKESKATGLKLPAGAQLKELCRLGEKRFLTPAQIQYLLGVPAAPTYSPREPEKASDEEGAQGFGQLRLVAERGPDQPSLEARP